MTLKEKYIVMEQLAFLAKYYQQAQKKGLTEVEHYDIEQKANEYYFKLRGMAILLDVEMIKKAEIVYFGELTYDLTKSTFENKENNKL